MSAEEETLAANKAVVVRFNKEVVEQGNEATFRELMAAGFVNRSAPPGAPSGPEGMLFTFNRVLRPAFPDLSVAQTKEPDLTGTRRTGGLSQCCRPASATLRPRTSRARTSRA
jgi:hypothetical protein